MTLRRLPTRRGLAALLLMAASSTLPLRAEPPYAGTIFIDPDIITRDDPTTYLSVTEKGRGERRMFDRRTNSFQTVNARLFSAQFSDSRAVEVQVNPEFPANKAHKLAVRYAKVIGRLPKCLRADLDTVWIHAGEQPFGGGNRNLLIHTGQSALYEKDGILEETLLHEACHTSLDDDHAAAQSWIDAQKADPEFISTYARDNPTREDVAETFLLWLAVRHRAERIGAEDLRKIHKSVPARLRYFDARKFDVSPVD